MRDFIVPVVSLVGRSGSGKTTLLEQLIRELKSKGYKVGTIKHHVHEFAMDTPGKDTWRHKQAGAQVVALSSPTGLGVIRDTEEDTPLEELVEKYFYDVDLILTEGYKHAAAPKIEIFRAAVHEKTLENRDNTWIAMVSDAAVAKDLPRFSLSDVKGLADFLIARFVHRDPEVFA